MDSQQPEAGHGLTPFNKENVAKVKDRAGNYYFYSRAKRLLYVGWSEVLRHRLQSYYQKDDFKEHRTKRALRPLIKYFSVVYRPLKRARKVELQMKQGAPHNHKAEIRR